MNTLLTFAGLRDPFYHDWFEDGTHQGPILSLLNEKSFDRVVLFSRPYRTQAVEKTAIAIRTYHPRTRVEVIEVDIRDATFYPEILARLRPALQRILKTTPNDSYAISPSSGTPEIHACWVLIVACGEFPARIYNFQRVAQGGFAQKSMVRTITLQETGSAISPEVLALLTSRTGQSREEAFAHSGILGQHPSLRHALETAVLISDYDGPVVIEGEPGTGKKLFATFIHRLSARNRQPCITVNCSALPQDIADGVLFGEKTPAGEMLTGKLQAADGGTLILAHIHDLPDGVQTRLLNFLEEGLFFTPGAMLPLRLNVRVIATAMRRLQTESLNGRFREDLAQRFAAERLPLPALRERRSDIGLLAQAFLREINQTLPRAKKLSAHALSRLENYSWPGNVAELRSVLVQAALTTNLSTIEPEDFDLDQVVDVTHEPGATPIKLYPGFSLETYLAGMRKSIIAAALRKTEGNQSKAARLLGISPQAVSKFVKDHPV